MNNEIEIKLLANPQCASVLLERLAQYSVLQTEIKTLTSVYFDTPDHQLMRWGMGLRIRSGDGDDVQTLKTNGVVVGGLHQRPEYNTVVKSNQPQLYLFDQLEWPADANLNQLNNLLAPLFTTTFSRQTWLLDLDNDTLIEVAFDQGSLTANTDQEAICEIELELVKGDVAQLFELAKDIATIEGLRLANISKAKRGYLLATTHSESVKPLVAVPLNDANNTAESLTLIFLTALEHWQYHEQLFVERPSLAALEQLSLAVQMLCQACKMFSELNLVECPWLAELRWLRQQFSWINQANSLSRLTAERGALIKKLPQQRSLLKSLQQQQLALPQSEQVIQLLHSTRYCNLMLKITRWLYESQWQKNQQLQSQNIRQVATEVLDTSWSKLRKSELAAPEVNADTYIKQAIKLRRNLLVGICVGELFEADSRQEFRLPWVDILSGIDELSLFKPLRDILPNLDQEQQKPIEKWMRRKEQSLLEAIEFSRQQALQQAVYW
ncbi:CYTH and CHAD domain-containing protein [Agarivorans sp. MS3-6]|uniref:CYTH and CHAD domain-containing protein n=1 Tax=Agarivorans sp. TSD2052 TaxID=2937286 RepID=UPI0020105609|nr:CYTH domain-containing protein [Agarivorans sp. TSD2052]UPW19384.1 CYTH domain-containing protein [Agarivorans sp. TSD2052]